MYCQGEMADRLTRDGKFDEIVKGLELIRSYGKPAGIGAHRLETVQACVEQGIKPDFWVKSLASPQLLVGTTPGRKARQYVFALTPRKPSIL